MGADVDDATPLNRAPVAGTGSYIGMNRSLRVRYLVGTNDVQNVEAMRRFVRKLKDAGYDARFTLVEGADHYSAYTPGTASPALKIIMNVARNP